MATETKSDVPAIRRRERTETAVTNVLSDALQLLKAARPDKSVPAADWEAWWMRHDSAVRRLEAIVKEGR